VRVAFRADSSTAMGTGHLVRCLNLADSLTDKGVSTVFLCRDLFGNVAHQVRGRGHELVMLRADFTDAEADALDTVAALPTEVEWLVVDNYALGQTWEARVRARARRIFVIDDLFDRHHDCDVLLDQNCGAREALYQDLVPPTCRLLLGPRYALLHRAFERLTNEGTLKTGTLRTVIVFFGGSDPNNETAKALEALRIFGQPLTVDVIVGSANPHAPALRELVRALPQATLSVQVDDMPERLGRADLAIGAGGISALERCRAGLPCLTIAVAENQDAPSRALAECGASIYLGRSADVTSSSIAEALRVCSRSPGLLRHLSERAFSLVDGRGTERVVEVLGGGSV
jgi:UDP-2,4-diacetamido-2,4,6-trideoxy-beta-L-altropyranose hydrolase